MILPMIGALIGGQIAVTRTGKLRKDIRENINLLGPNAAPATIRPWRLGPSGPVLPLGSCNRMMPWAVPSVYGKRGEHWTAFVSSKMIAHLLADEGGLT